MRVALDVITHPTCCRPKLNLQRCAGALGLLGLLLSGCAAESAGDSAPDEELGQVEERLFNTEASVTPADQTVRVQRLAYRCGFAFAKICDNTSDNFGVGVDKLRAIPGSDKEDIFVAFPNGHPTDPSTVIVLSAGMQDVGQTGLLDSITGQEDGWRPSGVATKGADRKLLGNSLWGRLKADPRVSGWGNAYVIVVLDNAAGWSDGNSREIHEAFARFAFAKVTASTKRVVLAGYSRGGIMVAEMGRHLRTTSGTTLSDSVALFVGTFDAVAGGGGKFGVNNTKVVNNPLVDNSKGDDFMKETTVVENQIPATKRQNKTFYYNDVSGGRVVSDLSTIHGFGSVNYDIVPSYWTEHWETLPHTNYKDVAERVRILDPFMDWLNEMDIRGRAGMHTTNHADAWVGQGADRSLYLEAKLGTQFSFMTTWNDSVDKANLDLEVFDSSGALVASGNSLLSWKEEVTFRVPRTDTYRVRVFAKSGSASTRAYQTVSYDVTRTGYVYLPNERVNSINDYHRTFQLPSASAGRAINLELTWDNPANDVDLWLYNRNGVDVARSRSTSNAERISYLVPSDEGPYRVVVESYSRADAHFELRGTAPLLP